MRRSLLTLPALLLALALAAPLFALDPLIPSKRLVRYDFELTGQDEQAILQEAAARAVKNVAGRIYFTDYMLRARDLLDAYLDKNSLDFIARHHIETNEIRGGRRFMKIGVMVDSEKLFEDLQDKHFLYRPEFRPVFTLFLTETFNGSDPPAPVGRLRLLEKIVERKYRYLWAEEIEDAAQPIDQRRETPLPGMDPTQDVTITPELFEKARRESQRNEVEVFVSGTIATTLEREEKLYYDDYHFVETRISLQLVRVDTGEVLSSVETVTKAGHEDVTQAVNQAVRAAVDQVADELFEPFEQQWAKTIHRKADMRILIVNTDTEAFEGIIEILKGVSRDSELYIRGRFADTATVTLSWPGERADLTRLLERVSHPPMSVARLSQSEMMLELLK